MIDLKGQTALVFGGPPTLAEGIMGRLRSAGALSHPGDKAAFLAAVPGRIAAYLETFSQIDTVVILPTWYETGLFIEASPQMWAAALEANYECALYAAQAAAQHMIKRGVAGSIVFVASVALHMPLLQSAILGASLAGLYPLAKMAAVDCGQKGIRVNMLTVAWVEGEWWAAHLDSAEKRAYINAGIPLGRVATPQEVGDVCCFLASDLARYITGVLLPVDGGYTLTRSEGSTPYP